MSSPVLPVARSLVLCDAVARTPTGKVHLSGAFDAIRAGGFPHAGTRLVVFAQLTGGIGTVPTHIDIRHAGRDEVVYESDALPVHFPDRLVVVQVAVAMSRVVFPYPGMYTVEMFCHNQFVCDTTLHLLVAEEMT